MWLYMFGFSDVVDFLGSVQYITIDVLKHHIHYVHEAFS